MFEAQLDLAIELNRSVVIHCVRAHGDLVKILEQRFRKAKKNPVSVEDYNRALGFVKQIEDQNAELDCKSRSYKKYKKCLKKIKVFESSSNPKAIKTGNSSYVTSCLCALMLRRAV